MTTDGATSPGTTPASPSLLRWGALVVAASALFQWIVLVLPTRGLVFLYDDWRILELRLFVPWRERLFASYDEHLLLGHHVIFAAGYALFGLDNFGYVVTNWVLFVASLGLLLRLLHERTGDVRAAALATAFLGLGAVHRETIWWAMEVPLQVELVVVIAAYLVLPRAVERGGRWLAGLALLALAAPFVNAIGVVLAPALLVELALVHGRDRRVVRAALAALVPCALYLALYLAVRSAASASTAGRIAHVTSIADYVACELGLGFVKSFLGFDLTPGGDMLEAWVLALAYLVGVLGLARALEPAERRRLVAAHAIMAAAYLLIALGRHRHAGFDASALQSRYQLLAVVAWTTTIAFAFARVLRAAGSRGGLVVSGAILVLAGHAFLQAGAARADRRLVAPVNRVAHAVLVERVVDVVSRARGPVFDARLPIVFPGNLGTRGLVRLYAPRLEVDWTNVPDDASLAPYRTDPFLERQLCSPPRSPDPAIW